MDTQHKANQDLVSDIFNRFNGKNLEILALLYSQDVVFQDPIHRFQNLIELTNYYKKMYKNVIKIEFKFENFVSEDENLNAQWTMVAQIKGLNQGKEIRVHGASFFKFNKQGLVCYHRDYFDVGEMLYEQLPVLKYLIKGIKNQLN